MKPTIKKTKFGSITLGGETYEHDVLIRLDGAVKKRKKKLSKEIYGTSHTLSLPEAEFIYEQGARQLIIGSGQSGMLELSPEAQAYFAGHDCQVEILPTPEAIKLWNDAVGAVLGLFHVTC
jgi:hypothetical protein